MQSFSRMWITREEMEEYMSLARSRKDNVSVKKRRRRGRPCKANLSFHDVNEVLYRHQLLLLKFDDKDIRV
jgi:hypothetical protein